MKIDISYPHGTFPILDAGDGWLAVDKPAGMSVHNNPGADLISIVGEYVASTGDAIRNLNIDTSFGIAPVHRLDRYTSGVILLACRAEVFRHFSEQFETHTAAKHYIALLHGNLGPKKETGLWHWQLSKKAAGRQRPAGNGPKVPCKTHFTVLETANRYTLVACVPVTGRKHQIRRHAKLAGHPVVGDRRYGSNRSVAYLATRCGFRRLALHADTLNIRLPGTADRKITLKSSGLPRDILQLMEEA